MKLLITGFNGFVAGSLLAQTPADWELHGIGRSVAPEPGTGSSNRFYHQLDLLDAAGLDRLLRAIRPDAVIHAAAIANIDLCEREQGMAEAVNTGVTERLAGICAEIGAKLVFCSTDTVFDGQKGNYTEDDQPIPVNYYAQTKIRAEQAVLAADKRNVIARLALVMGLPVMGRGNSFLADMLEKLKAGETLRFADNEIRTPIDVITLGAALHELAAGEFAGIVHLAGNTRVNRYEMARRIALKTGFPDADILAINSNSLAGRACRPDDASLDNNRARANLKTPMLSLEEGLDLTLSGPPLKIINHKHSNE
ncbi:MAG TPA: NAD(P)-dependent oxidoreductase [Puia sp.]|nr:NAD(P)-dependent oxidoreductase [Puia sp.]